MYDISLFLPAILTAVGGLVVMMMAAYKTDMSTVWSVSSAFVVAAMAFAVRDLLGDEGMLFSGMVAHGGSAAFGTVIVLMGTLFTILLSKSYLEKIGHHVAEVYSLMLLGTTGMIVLASSTDLIATFVGLETM